ncbi:MAG: metallophosphoesterase [Proteobacteria bacterium]|nr:metallophosphoesterase [Pseudomonadota bacterium]
MARPILDPRDGDIEDDASSPKRRSLLALAGSLLAEISLPKLLATWVLLLGLPGLLLGAAPLAVTLWLHATLSQAARIATLPVLGLGALALLAGLGWLGGRKLLRLVESSFWSLNALAVQPAYMIAREGLRQAAERFTPAAARPAMRRATAALGGLLVGALCAAVIAAVWPATRWTGTLADLAAPLALVPTLLANGTELIFVYCAAAAIVWGAADAAMDQPRDLPAFALPEPGQRRWRVAHLSDLHTVGERFGFRIECGRDGPRGNERLHATFARLAAVHAADPLDAVLISGDMTDAGRSAEWAEFFAALGAHPELAALAIALPGNHDVNVVDRASPARMELPVSPMKRLRQMRTLSALAALHGARLQAANGGAPLDAALRPHASEIAALADEGGVRRAARLGALWADAFPMILPPATPDGLGVLVLNSNAETHFSFTNALGLVSAEQTRAALAAAARYPQACWIVALHHHLMEYPQRAKALSERIGTAVINGSWFVRQLRPLAGRAVIMHGHRHIDWIGECAGLTIVSAPSPVMEPAAGRAGFYVHTFLRDADGRLRLLQPQRVAVEG